MVEDEVMADVEMVDKDSRLETAEPNRKKNAVDVEELLKLLDVIKRAGDVIADKDVMLLIGLTGAGKTTSTLYLAGAKFEEEETRGYTHYKPTELPNPDLSEFAVSGGSCSVTKAIHATTIDHQGDNGQQESITVCDTPGFGDTKGPEMEVSNGLGIIHALKRARSIKVVVVLDHRTMDGARWQPLRKNLSTIIAMMGRESLDFSTFSYIFTRCEGKAKKRVSKQLSGFGQDLHENPEGILGKNVGDKHILEAFVADMVAKTKPDDVVCIDPEEPDDAPDTLRRLWSGGRINNPSEAFVNFCSQESLAALLLQVKIMLDNLDSDLRATELESAERCLCQMIRMDEALSLPEVKEAVEQGKARGRKFVEQISTDIKQLVNQMGGTRLSVDEFEEKAHAVPPKLQLLASAGGIGKVCGVENDYNAFLKDIVQELFTMTRQPITNSSAAVGEKADLLEDVLTRCAALVGAFEIMVDSDMIQNECASIVDAVEDMINPVLATVKESLADPTCTALKASIENVGFLLEMQAFFGASGIPFINLTDPKWGWFNDGVDGALQSLTRKSCVCVERLQEVDKALEELLGAKEKWSPSSLLKLTECADYKEHKDFLLTVLSHSALSDAVSDESTPNFLSVTEDFDQAISQYLSSLADFVKNQTKDLYDNQKEEVSDRVKKAQEILELLNPIMVATKTLQDSDSKVLEDFIDTKGKLNVLIEESKKSRGHGIRRPKKLEPTPEELARATNAPAKKGLMSWYRKCAELRAYYLKEGHTNVPFKDPRLGIWVMTQRAEKKKYETGLKTAMTDEKLQHLADMDFQWDPKKAKNEKVWNQRYEELVKYKEEHGNCRVPQQYKKNKKLGKWVSHQRNALKAQQAGGKDYYTMAINEERMAKLEEVGLLEEL